jgi:hypothetical protein
VIRSTGPVDAPAPKVAEVADRPSSVALQVPRDHAAVRAADPALGAVWRETVGSVLESRIASGMAVVAFDPDREGGRPTYYLSLGRAS